MADQWTSNFQQVLNIPIRMYTNDELRKSQQHNSVTAADFFELQEKVKKLEKQVAFLMEQQKPINPAENL